MVVRLRLARWGRSNLPFYRIVAADSRYSHFFLLSAIFHCCDSKELTLVPFSVLLIRFRRDGRHLEQLGTYDPIPDKSGSKNVRLNISRVKVGGDGTGCAFVLCGWMRTCSVATCVYHLPLTSALNP